MYFGDETSFYLILSSVLFEEYPITDIAHFTTLPSSGTSAIITSDSSTRV